MRTAVAIAIRFALLFAASTALAEVRNPDAVAVIIGNKDYKHERVPDVSYAHRDAEAMKRYVVDVLGYDPENIIDLRDATQGELSTAFGRHDNHKGTLWRYIDPDGRSDVTVFFSGHGVPGQNDKRGYLLPVDADPNTAEINGYAVDVLYANLAKLKARSITVLLDACFSGDSHNGMLIRSASPVFIKTKIEAPKNMTVLTAASGEQLASWDEERRHGLFTDRFLEGVYGKADQNGDGNISLAEMKRHLKRTMTKTARRVLGRVQDATIIGASEIVLARLPNGKAQIRPSLGGEPAAMPSATAPVPVPASPPQTTGPSMAIWNVIQNSQKAGDFETFLESYPNSPMAPFAKARLEEIRKSKESKDNDKIDSEPEFPEFPGDIEGGSGAASPV